MCENYRQGSGEDTMYQHWLELLRECFRFSRPEEGSIWREVL